MSIGNLGARRVRAYATIAYRLALDTLDTLETINISRWGGVAQMSMATERPEFGASAYRFAAIGTGDLYAATQDAVHSIHREARGDQYKAIELGLNRMQENGLINSNETEHLLALMAAVRDSSGEKFVPSTVAQRARDFYYMLLADPQSSPVALAFASGLNGLMRPIASSDAEGNEIVAYLSTRGAAALGGFVGGIVGGLIGLAGGGGPGAAAGGSIGFTLGACLAVRSLGGDDD